MSTDFEAKGPNVVASKDGELHIARVGLSVSFRGHKYEIDSEMLAPPMTIAIYFRSSSAAKAAAKAHELGQLREFVRDALTFRGFDVEID
ncbi:hypothetical protein [Arthrobacter sp. SLBN-112]|uniref:hypothetical protein n=1 Tax=Arthrobacter sp. SLBN-112 TaxID=2768452 RepID=UPI0027B0499A|nr:hypothetical protein [Arthrobacter sp. SLBN-112]MDQ0798751.1 hypothetical protein [Arthrobacter sp. SLBN-112]